MFDPGAVQPGLFDADEPATSFAAARRTRLDDTSWVEHVPGFLGGGQALFEDLLADPGWEQRERRMYDTTVTEPRLTVEFPRLADCPYPLLHVVAEALSDRYGTAYDGLWVNLYRDHHDSTGWHGDRGRTPVCTVPVLSLGAPRRFLVRPKDGGTSRVWTPLGGDLVVMGGRCQRDFRHCVPKQSEPAGARISVNFSSRAQRA